MGFKNKYDNDESETGYKFDARLRYVENLITAHIIYVQIESQRKTTKNKPPTFFEKYNKCLLDLFFLLRLHDDQLEEPELNDDIKDEYVNKLLYHDTIKKLTRNDLDKKTIEENVDIDYE